jgi:hypothetical protein
LHHVEYIYANKSEASHQVKSKQQAEVMELSIAEDELKNAAKR